MKPWNGTGPTDGFDHGACPSFLVRCPLVDALVVGYLGFTGGILLVGGMHRGLPWGLLLLHVAGIALIGAARHRLGAVNDDQYRVLRFLHAWYPTLLLPMVYNELQVLNRIVWGRYFDRWVWAWEHAVFGTSPVIWFSEKVPSLWVSEALHFSYTFYYLMIPILGFALYGHRRYRTFQAYLWTLLATFFFCYLWFIFFPVEGPRYSFPPLAGELQRGLFYRFSHWILDRGAARGAAFPSSHVAAALVTLFCAWRWSRRTFWFLLPLGTGLVLGTVYGRFHYGIDALGGIVVAILFAFVGPGSYRVLARRFCTDAAPTEVSPIT